MENVLQTGLDRSLPHIGVIMQKFDTGRYPKFTLPGGFSFCSFRPGLEEQWARLQHQVGGIDSLQEARTIFYQEFLLGKGYNWLGETPPAPAHTNPASFPCYEQMCKRMVFITDSQSQLAGTAALWQGTLFGRPLQRIHWVAVRAGCQGLGLAKALLTRALDLYWELDCCGPIYLTSQTWSYRALHLYHRFDFMPYFGEKPPEWLSADISSDGQPWDYAAKNQEAWRLIFEKWAAYDSAAAAKPH